MIAPLRPIEFYFDFLSPYAYIASEWIEALAARHGRTVDWRAVLVGATCHVSTPAVAVAHPLKSDYTLLDVERSARFAGVPLKMPRQFPMDAQNVALIFWWLHSSDPRRARDWARHSLRALFARGVDVSEPAELQRLATEFGLDPSQGPDVWNDAGWKSVLRSANDAAIALGVFGVPFFIVDGEPFWGNDRRPQIERWLDKGPF
jgi:2-hydroxychromene-2-carboxylate isomerase